MSPALVGRNFSRVDILLTFTLCQCNVMTLLKNLSGTGPRWISHLETGEGAGLWSLFALTYAENTVTHILGGKGNGRVMRGFLL